MKVRVCIADDHALILDAIRKTLLATTDIDVVGIARSGDEVLPLVDDRRPHVVLLDHHMPGANSITCVREIKRRWPEIQVVMLSASEDPARIAEALEAGASAYLGKRIDPAELGSALRQVAAGEVYEGSASAAPKSPDPPGHSLTPRELAILEAMAEGLSTKLISAELRISEKTVKFHLTNVYRKLGVHNRTGAMRHAYQHGLIGTPAEEHPRALDGRSR